MADGIFTEEELKAQEQQPGQEEPQKQTEGETEEQKAERERDEQGRFKAKEPSEAPAEHEEGEEGKQKTVPQEALHAERKKRQAIEGELGKVREQLDALAKMREQIASRKPADLPAADDPAAIEHLRNRLAELEGNTTRITQHMDRQAIDAAEVQQLGSVMAESEARFRTEKPDYDAAIEHVVLARANELKLYGLTPPQIQAAISEEAQEIVRSAVAQGRDPAELGYQIALSRGYRPQQKQESTQEQQKPGASAAQRTLDAIAEARKQSKSLGGSGGSSAKTLNAEAVLAMSPEEFEAVYSTPEGKAMIDSL